ncbi:MAG: DMT family transporter [Lachnospiraceae bacterium]|nr:DMT family transporter [Lachnospiraceae bacterium]
MGILFMIISALNYSTSGVWVAVLGDCGLDTVMLSFTRLLFVVLICLAVCAVRKTDLRLTRTELLNHVVFGAFGLGLTTFLYDSAARAMSVGPTALCHFTYPLIVSLISGFVNREKFGKWKAIASVLMFAGLGLASGGGAVTAKGVAFALASALTFALYVYALDHTTMRSEDPFKLNFYNALASCILMLVLSFVTRGFAVPTQGTVYLSMVLAAATGLLGGVFLAKGVRIVGASKAAFLSILEPAAAFIWDVVIFRTALGAMAVAGVVLTFASFFAILLDKPKETA